VPTLPVLLKNPRILLVGGGKVALQKAMVLKEHHISFQVFSDHFSEGFKSLGINHALQVKTLSPEDTKPFHIIIDATGNPEVKNILCEERRKRFLLVNSVDDPDDSDFYFSALLTYGRLKVAVSTDGASPALAQAVRDRIRQSLPADIEELVEKKAEERKSGVIDAARTRQEVFNRLGHVDLVGCGPGAADLLTLQACRSIAAAEVVLYDHLIAEEILAMVPQHAERIYVGKQKQEHGMKQEEINRLILSHAQCGRRVARLKSGDPYVFGRGAEEAEFLARHGIRVQVVPGISSAIAAPSVAGIPLTARGYATNASIVSAHLAGSKLNTDWLPLLQVPSHTTVVLMGLSFAEDIAAMALAANTPANMPVAIISQATLPSQKVIITSLGKLSEQSTLAERPAILVFGDVVNLHGILPVKSFACPDVEPSTPA